MAAEGGWRPAGGGRRRRRRREEEAEEGGAVLRRLREARNDLLSSGFWAACTGACGGGEGHREGERAAPPLPPPGLTPLSVPAGAVRAPLGGTAEPPARCVCYGLGRFSCCPAARHQLAFLLLLLEELGVPPGRCSVFDPAFSAQEAAALAELGLRLLPDNEVSGDRGAGPPSPLLRGRRGQTAPGSEGGDTVRSPVPGGNGTHWFPRRRGNMALRDQPRCFTWCTAGKPCTTTSSGGIGPQEHYPRWSSSGTALKESRKGVCSSCRESFWCLQQPFPLLASFAPLVLLTMISMFCSFFDLLSHLQSSTICPTPPLGRVFFISHECRV
ncbi:SRR1-like protein isoform 2-T2 [Alca torda]